MPKNVGLFYFLNNWLTFLFKKRLWVFKCPQWFLILQAIHRFTMLLISPILKAQGRSISHLAAHHVLSVPRTFTSRDPFSWAATSHDMERLSLRWLSAIVSVVSWVCNSTNTPLAKLKVGYKTRKRGSLKRKYESLSLLESVWGKC